jgi:hypothetical protein
MNWGYLATDPTEPMRSALKMEAGYRKSVIITRLDRALLAEAFANFFV